MTFKIIFLLSPLVSFFLLSERTGLHYPIQTASKHYPLPSHFNSEVISWKIENDKGPAYSLTECYLDLNIVDTIHPASIVEALLLQDKPFSLFFPFPVLGSSLLSSVYLEHLSFAIPLLIFYPLKTGF